MRNLPNADEKLAEFKQKLEELTKEEADFASSEAGKKRAEEMEKAKQRLGGNWDHVDKQMVSAVNLSVMVEAFGTDAEWFVRTLLMYPAELTTIPHEHRKNIAKSLGIDANAEPDKFWEGLKDYLKRLSSTLGQQQCDQLKAKFDLPEEVVRHAREQVKVSLCKLGYRAMIDLFSDDRMKRVRENLADAERKLAKYPDWQEVEQQMYK